MALFTAVLSAARMLIFPLMLFTIMFFFVRKSKISLGYDSAVSISAAGTSILLFAILLGACLVGIYSFIFTWIFQLICLVLFVFFLFRIVRYRKELFPRISMKSNWWTLAFFVVALALLVLNLAYSHETIFGGRDEGIYYDLGLNIAKTGKLISAPLPSQYYSLPRSYIYPGIYTSGNITSIMSTKFFPILLSYGYRLFGMWGIRAVNPFLSFFSSILFFALLKRFVSKPLAAIFSIIMTWNILQIWFSRMTLTEIGSQLLILASIYVTIRLSEKPAFITAITAGILWGSTALSHNDGLLFFAVVAVIMAYLSITDSNFKNRIYYFIFGATGSITFFLAFLMYYKLSYYYYFDLSKEMKSLIYLGIGLMIVCFILSNFRWIRERHVGLFKIIGILCFAFFVAGFLISIDIRPYFPIDSLIPHVFSEYSNEALMRLQMYLGISIIVLAFCGVMFLIYKSLIKISTNYFILLVVFASFTLLYLFDPKISPDLHWGMRRFMPDVIPGFIFASAVFVQFMVQSGRLKKSIAITGALAILCVNAVKSEDVLFYSDHAGLIKTVEQFNATLPTDAYIFTDYPQLGGALFMGFQRNIYFIDTLQAPIQEKKYYLLVTPSWYKENQQPDGKVLRDYKFVDLAKERIGTGMPLKVTNYKMELLLIQIGS